MVRSGWWGLLTAATLLSAGWLLSPVGSSTSSFAVTTTTTGAFATTVTTVEVVTTTTLPVDSVFVDPGDLFSEAFESAIPGTTFVFLPGVHTNVSVIPRDGDVFVGVDGAVLDGEGDLSFAFYAHDVENLVGDVQVRGLVIERYATPAQQGTVGGGGTLGWIVEGNEIRYNGGSGVGLGEAMLVTGNYIHHNEQLGVHAGYPISDAVIEGNEIAHNNHLDIYDMAWEAGGVKILNTTDLVVRGNSVHHNHGVGLWTDANNLRTRYEGNTVVDNHGPGILHEISYTAVIRDNVVSGNGHRFYLGGILVADSSDVEVVGNHLSGNNGGVIGIHDSRGTGTLGPYELRNLWVHDNTIAYEVGVTGVIRNAGSHDVFRTWNNRFDHNRYELPSHGRPFHWAGATRSRDRWLAYGHDADSTWR